MLFRATGDNARIALTLCELGANVGAPYDPRRDLNRALSLIEESLNISRRQNEPAWITVYALFWLACMTCWQTDLPHAMSLLEECLISARQLGDALSISETLKYLADVSGAQLDFATAAEFAREALQVAQEIGDTVRELLALCQLADEYRYMGSLIGQQC